jgi:acyl carrier protein
MIPPAAPQTASTPASSSTSPQDAVEALWQIIAEKTGYPTEMLELSMDLEADLGIDSIKRVEILGALQEALPQLETKAEDLAELRTLAQIAEAIGGTPAPSASAQEQATPPQAAASEASTDLGAVLLDIVAEKTGYPTEMLELSMDLEADLGIDSIKRVEILGALQEREPNLPVQAEELAERRTLGDIVAAFAHGPEKKNS